jgi:hypothetical protein
MDAAELKDDDLHEKRMARLQRERQWRNEVIELLDHVITADQVLDHNNTTQDTRRDGPLARQARGLIERAKRSQ